MQREIEVKGTVFDAVLFAAESSKGADFVRRVRDAIPGEAGEALRFGGVVASGWYPVAWYRQMYGAIVAIGGSDRLAVELGHVSTARDITTIHRVLFRVLSVELLLKQSGKVLAQYFRGARITVTSSAPRSVRLAYSDFHGFDRILWLDLLGSAEEMLLQTGAKAVWSRYVEGGTDASPNAVLEAGWQ